jgi:hypothetical protein
MNEDSSEARNNAARATSAGSAIRPSKVCLICSASRSAGSSPDLSQSVSIGVRVPPGTRQLTRMFCPAQSTAIARAMLMTPAFAAQIGDHLTFARQRGIRGCEDHGPAASALERWQPVLREIELTCQIDRNHLVPNRARGVLCRPSRDEASVAVEGVNSPELALDGVDQTRNARWIGNVCGNVKTQPAGTRDFLGDTFSRLRSTRSDGHVGAVFRK